MAVVPEPDEFRRRDYLGQYSHDQNSDLLSQSIERERLMREQFLKYTQPAIPIYVGTTTPAKKPKWDDPNLGKSITDILDRIASRMAAVTGSYSDHAAGTAADAVEPIIPAGLEDRFLHREDERVTYLADIFTRANRFTDPVVAAQLALAAMQKYYEDKVKQDD